MLKTTTVIVGAGHCGLAMSRCLAARSVDHVVLERGGVANSWRTQRWDSLRLLTPNREWRFISALAPTAVPVPTPVAYCADTAVTGAEFYVMGPATWPGTWPTTASPGS
jgi:cation diffusion facilitator CzcD-associated flavoprotein CzcO